MRKHKNSKECELELSKICHCLLVEQAEVEFFVCCGFRHKTCHGRILYDGKIKRSARKA